MIGVPQQRQRRRRLACTSEMSTTPAPAPAAPSSIPPPKTPPIPVPLPRDWLPWRLFLRQALPPLPPQQLPRVSATATMMNAPLRGNPLTAAAVVVVVVGKRRSVARSATWGRSTRCFYRAGTCAPATRAPPFWSFVPSAARTSTAYSPCTGPDIYKEEEVFFFFEVYEGVECVIQGF
ncbi:unnamed protein product [Ectocarpus sp. 13 AM-2016]